MEISQLNLVGERLCLDYANTAGWHSSGNPSEWIVGYEELIAWGIHAGILSKERGEILLEIARKHPRDAKRVHQMAIEFREAIFRIFRSVAEGTRPDANDLDLLNQQRRRAADFEKIKVGEDGGFGLDFVEGSAELDAMIWPVTRSAVELLLSPESSRVKECEGTGCGWLFLDTSRNRSRRWCSMEDCGNREKARRHYRKKKANPK